MADQVLEYIERYWTGREREREDNGGMAIACWGVDDNCADFMSLH